MSSRVDPPKVPHHEPERRPPAGRLDKAFPVFLEGEVRYQCFINFTRADAVRAGMRGIGLRFVTPKGAQGPSRGTIH